jgi:protein-tyrosine-phosphatase
MTNTLKTVPILCTGNSCRSQRAEALINQDLAVRDDIRARLILAVSEALGVAP